MGCHGGLMNDAFEWMKKNKGVCSLADYPYTSGETKTASTCNMECKADINSAPIKYKNVKKNSDEDLMKALMQQPVSVVSIPIYFYFYFYLFIYDSLTLTNFLFSLLFRLLMPVRLVFNSISPVFTLALVVLTLIMVS